MLAISCDHQNTKNTSSQSEDSKIECSCYGCEGTYSGPEFIDDQDVAHQFSNKMCKAIGDELKKLYSEHKYVRVNFSQIEMSTEGMGSGHVIYKIMIPFENVNDPCEAFTSFDHVGGWNHAPALNERIKQLEGALLLNDTLYISDLKTTAEGLQEYWIQWRNKELQVDCH